MSRSLCHWTPRIWGQTLNTSSTMHDIKTSSFIKDQWKQLTIWNSHLSPTSFQTSTRQTLTCLPRLSKQTQDKLLPVSHVFPNKHKTKCQGWWHGGHYKTCHDIHHGVCLSIWQWKQDRVSWCMQAFLVYNTCLRSRYRQSTADCRISRH